MSRTGLSAGVTVETVSRWENRKIGVGWKNRRALAQVFGLPVVELSRLIDDDAPADDGAAAGPRPDSGPRAWVIPVAHLPWRTSAALGGLSGVHGTRR